MENNAKCRRCLDLKWVPIEGTITCAIEAQTDESKRIPCPECATSQGMKG